MTISWNGDSPLKISNSEIQTFKSCRRKWYLAYYLELGLKREFGDAFGPGNLGSKVHIALHAYYVEGANPITVVNELYAKDIEFYESNERFTTDDINAAKKEQDLARAMLEGYIMWASETAVDAGLSLVSAESVVEVPSGIPGVILRGKLDQRWQRDIDGARLFRDFKTVPEFTTMKKLLVRDEQMKFYHLLEFLDAMAKTGGEPPDRTIGALYTMLRKVKRTATARPPFYEQVEISHNKQELASMWSRVHRVITEIVQTRYSLMEAGDPPDHNYIVPPRPSRDCTWACDFESVCSMMDDGSNWRGMLQEHYTHVDPHERYNAQDKGLAVTE